MNPISSSIHASWLKVLQSEFDKEYFKSLKSFLETEKDHSTIFPPEPKIFAAFNNTLFNDVKVVVIGQDPYHGIGQANGLCFSVSSGIKPPPSLANIYKEMLADLGLGISNSGDLSPWTEQGVLLLNTVLTVREKNPGSHKNQGWENFTDATISILSSQRENLVFILWGKFAQGKKGLIDLSKHMVIESAHPSPFSAYNGFFGSKPFSKTNAYLKSKGQKPVNWKLT